MGTMLTVECSRCPYTATFYVGVGYAFGSVESILYRVHSTYIPRILAIIRQHPDHKFDVECRLYSCPKCHDLKARLYLKIEYGAGERFEIPMRCGRCRTPMREVETSAEVLNVPCPECGNEGLPITEAGTWD
jgi:Zn finger protein HypA/HybF involved in hydrogenase expression